MSTPTRRSGRQRKVNPKYTNDGWDTQSLRLLRASSESSKSESVESTDFDLDESMHTDGVDSSRDGHVGSILSAADSQASDLETHEEEEDKISVVSDENARGPRAQTKGWLPNVDVFSSTAHCRGIVRDIHKTAAKDSIYFQLFGPEIDDLAEVLHARDTWLKGRDATIPSRRTLSEAENLLERSSDCTRRAKTARDVSDIQASTSDEQVYELLRARQLFEKIGKDELQPTYLANEGTSHPVFLGPVGVERKFQLARGASLDFGVMWTREKPPNPVPPTDSEMQPPYHYHEGWLLNLGEKVQSIAWAPADGNGHQYLAVAIRCSSTQRQTTIDESSGPPAFHPSPPYPSNIQIWRFETVASTSPGVQTLNMKVHPELVLVIATNWGNNRQLRWQPDSRTNRNCDSILESEFHGVIGILSTDGHVRLLAISIPSRTGGDRPLILRPHRPGHDICPPPGTIFTAIAFPTSTDLILGSANGSIHLFDLTQSTPKDTSPSSYMAYPLHNTYVVAIQTASTSNLSHLIASTSAAGDLVLVDLRSPDQDQTSNHRSCFPNCELVYAPLTRSFITAVGRIGSTQTEPTSATYIMCNHIRQFQTSLRIAKIPEYSGAPTALAASQWHPCILSGNAQGTVMATNYLRKVLPHTRAEDKKKKLSSAYLQKICEYEWRPLSRDELEEAGYSASTFQAENEAHLKDLYHSRDVRPGASRFSEGFKPEKIEVGTMGSIKKSKREIGSAEAIFEEEQAVTAMEWNPNAGSASFAAIGWGSGLLRVQDLAHDYK